MNKEKRPRNHPVWDVYNEYRTARLNVKYYTAELNSLQRENFIIEVILALSVPSSAIAGLWFWSHPIGKEVWKYCISLSAILAFIKPFLNLANKIRLREEILTGYRSLEHDIQKLTIAISQDQKYKPKHRLLLEEALIRKGVLVQKAPRTRVNKRLRKKCRIEISKELPAKNFYLP
jgi:hypothetical protein